MHLQRPHHPRFLGQIGQVGRCVLLWFVLSLGVAVASPLVHPQAMELVCSSAGAIKVIVQTDDGAQELGATPHGLPAVRADRRTAARRAAGRGACRLSRWACAVQSIPAARLAAATAAPLPARGPPALS